MEIKLWSFGAEVNCQYLTTRWQHTHTHQPEHPLKLRIVT